MDANLIRDMQKELDAVIQQGVIQITRLLKNSENYISSGTSSAVAAEDDFSLTQQKQSYLRGELCQNFILFLHNITFCDFSNDTSF